MEETTKCAALYQNSDHVIFYVLSKRLMYLLQGLGNYMEDKKVDYVLEIGPQEFLANSPCEVVNYHS